jgi:hypothetical protein
MEEKMRQQKEKGRDSADSSSQETTTSEEITEKLNTELNTLEGIEGIKLTPSPAIQASESSTKIHSTPIPTIAAKLTPISKHIQAIPPKLPPLPKTEVESERLEVIEIKTNGHSGHLRPLEDRYEERK